MLDNIEVILIQQQCEAHWRAILLNPYLENRHSSMFILSFSLADLEIIRAVCALSSSNISVIRRRVRECVRCSTRIATPQFPFRARYEASGHERSLASSGPPLSPVSLMLRYEADTSLTTCKFPPSAPSNNSGYQLWAGLWIVQVVGTPLISTSGIFSVQVLSLIITSRIPNVLILGRI